MRLLACVLTFLMLAAVPSPALAADPVKIGFIAPLSGIFAPAGKDMSEGIRMAFDQAGYDHESAARLLGLHPNYLHRLIRALDLRTTLKRAGR